ncbi:MAG: hypothetical protein ACK4YH_02415 [Bacteroidota bacterium]
MHEVQPFNFLIVTTSIKELWLHLSSVRGATLDKPSEMMAFSFSISELEWLQLLRFNPTIFYLHS